MSTDIKNQNEPELTRVCCACSKEKVLKSYVRKSDGYYEKRCRICRSQRIKCEKIKTFSRDEHNHYRLDAPNKSDWFAAYKLLESIGYTIDETLHQQFCLKYNLPQKEKIIDKTKRYSLKELGL